MAIGNSNYVKKHYQPVIDFCIAHFDELKALTDKQIGTHSRNKSVAFRVELETHHSEHESAPHGVEFTVNKTWQPKSFYGGYHYITLNELRRMGYSDVC